MTLDPSAPVPAAAPNSEQLSGNFRDLIASLPDDVRQNPNVTRHQSFGDMVAEYTNAVSAVGRKGFIAPREGDMADTARFLKELGRPDSVDEYQTGDFVPPEGLPWDDDLQKDLVGLLHKAGGTQKQLEVLLPGYAEMMKRRSASQTEAASQSFSNAQKVLKEKLGHEYEPSMGEASEFMGRVFGDDAAAIINARLPDGRVLGNVPEFVLYLIEQAKASGTTEDGVVRGGPVASGGRTPKAALAEIRRLEGDPDYLKAHGDLNDPRHQEFSIRMAELYAQAYPEA